MKIKRAENNILVSFALSIGICFGSAVIVAFILALIANSSANSTENIPLFALITLVISAAVSGVVISRIKGLGGVKFSALSALAFVLILLLASVIANNGAVPPSAFMNYGCFIGMTAVSAYLGRKKDTKRRRKR
jgi:putative membrane protein (TIGR04086 family)